MCLSGVKCLEHNIEESKTCQLFRTTFSSHALFFVSSFRRIMSDFPCTCSGSQWCSKGVNSFIHARETVQTRAYRNYLGLTAEMEMQKQNHAYTTHIGNAAHNILSSSSCQAAVHFNWGIKQFTYKFSIVPSGLKFCQLALVHIWFNVQCIIKANKFGVIANNFRVLT